VLEDQPFCLDELIQERAAWIMPQADAHHFRITLRIPLTSPFKGDAFRMGQVVTILMENALRYGRDGGHLDVALHYASGHYILELPMTGRAYRPSSCRKCLNALAARSSPARGIPAAAVSVCPSPARFARRMGVRSARHYRKPAARSRILLPWHPSDNENSPLDKALTERRIFLD
jgi:hypothetical protein